MLRVAAQRALSPEIVNPKASTFRFRLYVLFLSGVAVAMNSTAALGFATHYCVAEADPLKATALTRSWPSCPRCCAEGPSTARPPFASTQNLKSPNALSFAEPAYRQLATQATPHFQWRCLGAFPDPRSLGTSGFSRPKAQGALGFLYRGFSGRRGWPLGLAMMLCLWKGRREGKRGSAYDHDDYHDLLFP